MHPAWQLVDSVVCAFLAGLLIEFCRIGFLWP
jgi:hypothetical protein